LHENFFTGQLDLSGRDAVDMGDALVQAVNLFGVDVKPKS